MQLQRWWMVLKGSATGSCKQHCGGQLASVVLQLLEAMLCSACGSVLPWHVEGTFQASLPLQWAGAAYPAWIQLGGSQRCLLRIWRRCGALPLSKGCERPLRPTEQATMSYFCCLVC